MKSFFYILLFSWQTNLSHYRILDVVILFKILNKYAYNGFISICINKRQYNKYYIEICINIFYVSLVSITLLQ